MSWAGSGLEKIYKQNMSKVNGTCLNQYDEYVYLPFWPVSIWSEQQMIAFGPEDITKNFDIFLRREFDKEHIDLSVLSWHCSHIDYGNSF